MSRESRGGQADRRQGEGPACGRAPLTAQQLDAPGHGGGPTMDAAGGLPSVRRAAVQRSPASVHSLFGAALLMLLVIVVGCLWLWRFGPAAGWAGSFCLP